MGIQNGGCMMVYFVLQQMLQVLGIKVEVCSLWVIATGNMDYLHRQIPLEEWKRNVQKLLVKSGSNSLN